MSIEITLVGLLYIFGGYFEADVGAGFKGDGVCCFYQTVYNFGGQGCDAVFVIVGIFFLQSLCDEGFFIICGFLFEILPGFCCGRLAEGYCEQTEK